MLVPQGWFYEGMNIAGHCRSSDEFYQRCGEFGHFRVRHPDRGQGVYVGAGEWNEIWQPFSLAGFKDHVWIQVDENVIEADGWVPD